MKGIRSISHRFKRLIQSVHKLWNDHACMLGNFFCCLKFILKMYLTNEMMIPINECKNCTNNMIVRSVQTRFLYFHLSFGILTFQMNKNFFVHPKQGNHIENFILWNIVDIIFTLWKIATRVIIIFLCFEIMNKTCLYLNIIRHSMNLLSFHKMF